MVQVLGRHSSRITLHSVFPLSDRRGGSHIDFVLRGGHVQQYIQVVGQSPPLEILLRIADLEYRFIPDKLVLVFEDPFFG